MQRRFSAIAGCAAPARLFVAVALVAPAIALGSCGDDAKQSTSEQAPRQSQPQGQARRSPVSPAAARAHARRAARIERRAVAQRRAEARAQRRRERAQGRALAHSKPENAPGDDCAEGYDPCVPPYPPDVDCSDLTGPYSVTGSDPHNLDPDGDGKACR